MPGVSAISGWKLRPFSGMLATNCWSTTVLTAAGSVCNPKVSLRTVMLSDAGPSASVKFSLTASWTYSCRLGRMTVRKPSF